MRISTALLFCLMVPGGPGCTSEADDLTLDGIDALEDCDIRTAHERFAAAHASDPDHPQAALGFALTDLALLPEDPAVTAVLLDLGFTGALDMQALVFGPDGLLARGARKDTCESIEAFVRDTVPYPALAVDGPEPASLISADLSGEDIAAALTGLAPRLAAIAAALETAAAGLPDPIEVEGGCGLGRVALQPAELYAAAAVIEALRSFIQLAAAYDWDVSIRTLAETWSADPQAAVDELNAHILRVDDAGAGAAGRLTMIRAFGLATSAAAAAREAGAAADGLFDWTAFPDLLLDDADRLFRSVAAALEGPAPLADISPTLTADFALVYDDPIDAGALSVPLFTIGSVEFPSVQLDGAALEEALTPLFAPSPFEGSFTWAAEERWSTFDGDVVTAPLDRYHSVYGCMAAM